MKPCQNTTRIGVISDSHGDRRAIEQAIKLIGNADVWLHAGDNSQDARWIEQIAQGQVVTVAGNCDGHLVAKPDEFVELPDCRLWLTHGHRYHTGEGKEELLYWARQFEAKIVVYGHTHIPEIYWDQDLLVFNPGSISRPRGGFLASCGVLTISSNLVNPIILQL